MNESANKTVDLPRGEGGRFLPGVPAGPGRPAGGVDKKWASLDYWFKLIESDWTRLKPETRAKIAIDAWKALLARKQFPLTPQESVANADTAMRLLKVLEDASRVNADASRNRDGSANGLDIGQAGLSSNGSAARTL